MKKTTTLISLCRQSLKNTTAVKKSMLTLVGLMMLLSGFATNYTSNNVTGNWSNAASWSPAGVPGAGDNVTISQGTITVDAASSVAGITISGGTLKLSAALTVNGAWAYNSGTFTPNTQTVIFTTGSSIGGSSQTTLYGLTVNTTNATDIVNLTTGATIANNGVITFTKGILKLTGQTLSITKTAVINGNGGNFANAADGAGDTNADGGTVSLIGSSGGTTTVNGSVTFYNINTGTDGNVILDLQTATSIVNGTATIISQQGKFGNTNSPIWGPSSTLAILYKNGFNYTPGKEWVPVTGTQTATTPGYPNNVILSNTGNSAGGLGNGNGWAPASGDYSIRGVFNVGDAVNGNAQIDFSKLTNFSCGGFVLTSGSRFSAPSSMTVNGSWTDNQAFAGTITNPTAGFNHHNGTIIFGGTGSCISPNTITAVGTEAFNNLSVTNGAYVTLNSPVTVASTGVLALVAGVFKTSAVNSITVLNPSTSAVTVSTAINAFISGPLTWNLSAAAGNYGFPVGTGCIPALGGLPFGIAKAAGTATTVTVTPFSSNSGGTVDGTLSSISTTEYWSLTSTSSLTGSSIALARALPVTAGTLIAESNTANGVYASIGGTSFSNGVSGSTDIGSGTSIFFALGQPPIVSTLAATSITTTTATLNGGFNTQGASLPTSFNYGTTNTYGSSMNSIHSPINSTSSVADSALITGLTANTIYHFMATDGPNSGSDLTFTTAPNPPTVGTASNVTGTGFTANWTAPASAGTAPYFYTVQFSTDPTFATGVITQTAIASGTTSAAIGGLTSATVYYYRVQTYNASTGSVWSATESVSTDIIQTPPCTTGNGSPGTTGTISSASVAPVIDGVVDPVWATVPSNDITQKIGVNGEGSPLQGTPNNSSTWKTIWDATNLYILVQVNDAQLVSQGPLIGATDIATLNNAPNLWDVDGIEFYLDGNNNKGGGYDNQNDFQLRFNLGSNTVTGSSGNAPFSTLASNIQFKMQVTPGGYLLEAAIPWSPALGGINSNAYPTVKAGNAIGIDFSINDNDNTAWRTAQQGWYDGLSGSTEQYHNTTLFGTATLAACPQPPIVILPTVTNIGTTTATLGATVVSSGDNPLIARGTGYSVSPDATGVHNALPEGGTGLGAYAGPQRTGLTPQTKYYYVGYANNSDTATGVSTVASFYTLSALPTVQPQPSATACSNVVLSWPQVRFPNIDSATKGGYLILRSQGGNNPSTAGIVTRQAATQAMLQDPNTTLLSTVDGSSTLSYTDNSAQAGITYTYMLVPFTWDGNALDSTYNYNTINALTTQASLGVLTAPTFSRHDTTVCKGTAAWALPAPNESNITGLWNPATIDNSQSGPATYKFTVTPGLCAKDTFIVVTVTQPVILTFTAPAPICAGASYTLPTPDAPNNNISGTWNKSFDNTAIGATPYTFTPTAGQCATTGSLTITVIATPHITSITATPASGTPTTQIALAATGDDANASYIWTSNTSTFTASGLTATDIPGTTTIYSLSVTDGSCKGADSTVTVTIGTGLPCLSPMKAFTPNGDGFNEVWRVYAIGGCLTTAKVHVYNRWGGLVYHNDDYQNDWTGTYNGSKLPDGTYYYVVEAKLPGNNYTTTLTGNVTIIR